LLGIADFSKGFARQLPICPNLSIFRFIKAFAGDWPGIRARNSQWELGKDEVLKELTFHVRLFQIQFDKYDRDPVNTEWVFCSRESSTIPGLNERLKECRISTRTWFTLGSDNSPTSPIHSTLIVNDVGGFNYDDDYDEDDNLETLQGSAKVNRHCRVAGLISFQLALWGVIDLWREQWISVLDEIDNCLRSKASETSNSVLNY
jgi:hypothetical protein